MRVDKSIPIPKEPRGAGRYPFSEMEIGDSIFLEGVAGIKLLSAVNGYRSRHPGWHYVSRKENDGFRVWRVEKPDDGAIINIDRSPPAPSKDTTQDVWTDRIWQFISHERAVSQTTLARRFQTIPAHARETIINTLVKEGRISRSRYIAFRQGAPTTYYAPCAAS